MPAREPFTLSRDGAIDEIDVPDVITRIVVTRELITQTELEVRKRLFRERLERLAKHSRDGGGHASDIPDDLPQGLVTGRNKDREWLCMEE